MQKHHQHKNKQKYTGDHSDLHNTFLKNLNDLEAENLTKGHILADRVVRALGSWKFILAQTLLLAVWTALNLAAWIEHWDPYPFILMNLFLSMQAAYAAPIIMMSQNRKAERDRLEAHNDFLINLKAEQEICALIKQIEIQSEKIDKLMELISKAPSVK